MALADVALEQQPEGDDAPMTTGEEGEEEPGNKAPRADRALAALDAVLREADLLAQTARRLSASASASAREAASLEAQRGDLADAIARAARGIEAEKARLGEASLARQRHEEAEASRAVVAREPPRHESERAIAAGERELAEVRREGLRLRHLGEARRRQFALLLHALRDLEGVVGGGGGGGGAGEGGEGGAAMMAIDGPPALEAAPPPK